MSQGLKFRKADLHVHTPASECFPDEAVTPEQIIQAAISAGLDVIAITDHNNGKWIDRINEATENTPLTVFPGVEITATPGVHIIAIFEVGKGTDHINGLLSVLEIESEERGKSTALSKFSTHQVIDKIVERRGLAILAHIDDHRGAFKELKGIDRIRLFNEAPYAAVETSTGVLPPDFTKGHQFKKFPACYQASDNPDPKEPTKHSIEGIGTRYSFFKLATPINLGSLRQCFIDPKVRIRKMGEREEIPFPKIVSLSVSNGFLKDQKIRFHDGLNSIIGGKGVGKSLIVEFLRFALNQPSSDKNILYDHNSKLEKQLKEPNHVELKFETENGTPYGIIREVYGEPECTNLETGEPYEGSVREIFPILAYSQNEVIEISKNEGAQLELIDSFIDTKPYIERIEELGEKLKESEQRLVESCHASFQLDSFKEDLKTVEAQINEIDQSLSTSSVDATQLTEFLKLAEKKQAFVNQQDYLVRLQEQIIKITREIELYFAPPTLSDHEEADNDLIWAYQQSLDAQKELLSVLGTTNTSIAKKKADLDEFIQKWLPIFEAKDKEYKAELKKEEHKQKLVRRREGLTTRRGALRTKVETFTTLASALQELKSKRNGLLDELDGVYQDYFQERKTMFDSLTQLSAGKLKLGLEHAANRKSFETRLNSLLEGTYARESDIEIIAERMMPREFVDLVWQDDIESLCSKTDITESMAKSIVAKLKERKIIQSLLELEYVCYPGDIPSIQFRKENGQYAPLNDLSVGQKCTALLIIALSKGIRPIIIDQPEDALDIATVWEDVSMKLRAYKEKRQFILTTHNPSVAVSSDSDMFIVLRADASRAVVECVGAIESSDVKAAVIQHLEGGEKPYHLRREKYNLNRE